MLNVAYSSTPFTIGKPVKQGISLALIEKVLCGMSQKENPCQSLKLCCYLYLCTSCERKKEDEDK